MFLFLLLEEINRKQISFYTLSLLACVCKNKNCQRDEQCTQGKRVGTYPMFQPPFYPFVVCTKMMFFTRKRIDWILFLFWESSTMSVSELLTSNSKILPRMWKTCLFRLKDLTRRKSRCVGPILLRMSLKFYADFTVEEKGPGTGSSWRSSLSTQVWEGVVVHTETTSRTVWETVSKQIHSQWWYHTTRETFVRKISQDTRVGHRVPNPISPNYIKWLVP